VVAERLPEVSLGLMAHDDAPEVRRIVAERMSSEDAVTLLNDPDWVVRYTVAQLVAPKPWPVCSTIPSPMSGRRCRNG